MNEYVSIDDVVNSFIEIEPLDSDGFFKTKETLTRIGLVSRKQRK